MILQIINTISSHMKQLINKKFYHKTDPNNRLMRVVEHVDNIVVFENGTRCDESVLFSQYEESIDPDEFLNAGNYAKGIMSSIKEEQDRGYYGSDDIHIKVDDAGAEPPVPPKPAGTDRREYARQLEQQPPPVVETREYVDVDVDVDVNVDAEAHMTRRLRDYQQPAERPIPKEKDKPVEHSVFSRMQRKHKVKLLLVLEEMIPRPEQIMIMNDMFPTSLTEHLAKEMVDKIVNDPDTYVKLIQAEIEKKVFPEKKPPRKTRTNKKPANKKPTSQDKKEISTPDADDEKKEKED